LSDATKRDYLTCVNASGSSSLFVFNERLIYNDVHVCPFYDHTTMKDIADYLKKAQVDTESDTLLLKLKGNIGNVLTLVLLCIYPKQQG